MGIGEAVCRVERADYDFTLRTMRADPVSEDAAERRRRIVELSRQQYGTPRSAVEPEAPEPEASSGPKAGERENETTAAKTRSTRKGRGESTDDAGMSGPLPGRGGDHHKYLQQLVKRWAEGRGYAVTLEKPILDGLGLVDVALEKQGRLIACEISVTTDAEHEAANIQKCLAAGFAEIVVLSSDKKVLTAVRRELAGKLTAAHLRRIKFLTPEEAFAFIDSLEFPSDATRPAPDPSEILTAKELEALLRIDVKTIYSYVQKANLPYVKIQSNVRFLKSDILKWMEDRQYKPPAGRSGRNQK